MRGVGFYLLALLLLIVLLEQTSAQARRRSNSLARVGFRANRLQTVNNNGNRIIRRNGATTTRRLARGRQRRRNNGRVGRASRRSLRNRSRARPSARIVNNSVQARITGGNTAPISSMPYLVQVHNGANTLCGGSLIFRRWVLTAAHCVRGVAPSALTIVAGTPIQNGTAGVRRGVSDIFIAPRYTSRRMNMDAALLRLNASLTGNNIDTISLARRRPRPQTRVRLGGWGALREGGNPVRRLRVVTLRVVRQDYCQQQYANSATITPYMFCAQARNRDTCSGDSGGPAVQNGRLVGIVSFGVGCARPRYPGVYTNAPRLRPWINRIRAANS